MFAKTKHEPAKQSRGSSPFSHSAKRAHCPSLAQASLEYLLTYGWALILIATIVGVLVLIVSTPSGYACSRGLGRLICKAFGAQGEDLIITLQNATGQDISINPFSGIAFDGRAGYAIITYRGQQYRFEPATISKGDTFQITGIGLGNAGTASITYTETQTGMTRTETINLDTPQKEICNNGIPDAGGPVDALNPECETATYVLKATAGSTSGEVFTVTAGSPATFNFAVNDSANLAGKLDNDYRNGTQFTSIDFSFYIASEPPTDIAFNTNPTGNLSHEPFKQGWNTITLTTEIGLTESINFTLTRNTADFTITASGSPNAPVATIKVVEKSEVPPG